MIPLDYFFIFFTAKAFILSEKLSDHGQEEHKETPYTLGCSGIGLYLAVRAAYEI